MVREQSYRARYDYVALLVQTTSEQGVEKLLAFQDVRERWDVYSTQTKLEHKEVNLQKQIKAQMGPGLHLKKNVASLTYTNITISIGSAHRSFDIIQNLTL